MAEENGIQWGYMFNGETVLPSRLSFDNILEGIRDPWANYSDWTSETTFGGTIETIIGQIDILNSNESPLPVPGDVTLAEIYKIGYLTYDDLVALLPNVSDSTQILRLDLGKDEQGNHLSLKIDVKYISNHQYYNSYDVTSYIYFWSDTDPSTLSREIKTRRYNIYILDPWYSNHSSVLKFGFPLIKLPGREDGMEHMLMGVIIAGDNFERSELNFILSRSNATDIRAIYQVGPLNQSNSNINDGYSAFLDGVIDLERLSTVDMTLDFDYRSPEAGEPSGPGGYNPGPSGFDDSSDTIDIPSTPTIGVSDVGFVNVYRTSTGDLQSLGTELFPPLAYTAPTAITGTDTTEAIINGMNMFVAFLANIPSFFDQIMANTYINYVVDCHIIPVEPTYSSTPSHIKVGNKTLQSTGKRVTSDYVDFDCGTIELAEYYSNFADHISGFKLFLPFIGFVPARPEWFYRESLNVTYRFNVIDGSFVAFVRSTGAYVNNNNSGKTIVAQYGGVACVHLPITGVTYASMVSGMVGAGSGAVMAAGSGNIPALATSAIAAASAHGDLAQSNSYASSTAFLGGRRPYVLIERPVSSFSQTYSKENGIPSNVSKKLGSVTGFAMVGDIHLDGITATDQEKNEIERLLREGVIF